MAISIDDKLMDRADEVAKWKGVNRSKFWEMTMAERMGVKFAHLIPRDGDPPEDGNE